MQPHFLFSQMNFQILTDFNPPKSWSKAVAAGISISILISLSRCVDMNTSHPEESSNSSLSTQVEPGTFTASSRILAEFDVVEGLAKPNASSLSAVSTASASNSVKDTILLVAGISPPRVEGVLLQATDFRIKGKLLYASYNAQGSNFLGALQIIDLKKAEEPKLLQTIGFRNADIHSLDLAGNRLYLAGGRLQDGFSSPAFLEIIDLEKGLIPTPYSSRIIDLPSFAATSVVAFSGNVAVSVGALKGGVVVVENVAAISEGIHSLSGLSTTFHPLEDARYLGQNGSQLVCVKGTPGGLWILDKNSGLSRVMEIAGATIPESKSTVEVQGNDILLGMGDGGVQSFSLAGDKITFEVAAAQVAGLAPEKSVTNAVSGRFQEFFAADGEAGIRVLRFHQNQVVELARFSLGEQVTVDPKDGNGISVNAVVYHAQYLVMAAGLGGVQIAWMKRGLSNSAKAEAIFFEEYETQKDKWAE
jgi:hypothetical protein